MCVRSQIPLVRFMVRCLLVVPVLATAWPSAADPIIAEFSRTASVEADDGNGLPPVPLQLVNTTDRLTPVELLLTDGDFPSGSHAQAYARVDFGTLRALATTRSLDGLQKSATAEANAQDVLTISGAGTSSGAFRFRGAFSVTGSLSLPTTLGSGLGVTNASYTWAAYQNSVLVAGASANFTRNTSGFGEEGVNFLGSLVPVEFDFVWGTPIILQLALGAGAAANSGPLPGFAAASMNLSNSLTWQGATVETMDGQRIEASLDGDSGTDWGASAAVPEPGVLVLLGVGAVFVGRLRPVRRAFRTMPTSSNVPWA